MLIEATQSPLTRADIEDFLYVEADLLDRWDLDPWLALFRDDARYLIPSLDVPTLSDKDSLYLVADDMMRLRSRVGQLQGDSFWAENPLSRTRRIVSNVRIVEQDANEIAILANFAVYRLRHEELMVYVGQYRHRLAITPEGLRFIERKSVLDLESLRHHGKVSIIL